MTDKSNMACHPLRPVCILLNVVSTHLYRKQFMSPNLRAPLIKDDTIIRFLDAVQEQKQITADPTVSYKVGPFNINPTSHGAVSNRQLLDLRGAVTFEISTASEALTQELSFELGALCMAMLNPLKQEQCFILGSQISEVRLDPKSTFFLGTTIVNFSLGYPMWNTVELEGTLREVKIKIDSSESEVV